MNAKRRQQRWMPVAVAGAGIVVALLAVVWWARSMMAQKAKKPRDVPQVVQLIRPPPPDTLPPPPPPPPEKVEEPLPQDQAPPDQVPDAPSQALGLDADASAGSDAFGLAARKGGADLVGTGTAIFGRYTSLLKDTILGRLSDDERVRKGSYAVVVRVWVAADGSVQRVALVQGSGKRELDALIEQALSRSMRVAEPPPLEMPQPVTLRIVSRG